MAPALLLIALAQLGNSPVPSSPSGPMISQTSIISAGGLPFSLLASGSTETTECACASLVAATGQAITHTRSTTGTCYASDGGMSTCAANKPRVESKSGVLSLLVEPARTNLILRSQEFDNAVWTKFMSDGGTLPVTANADTAPDGTLSAESVAFNGTDAGWPRVQICQGVTNDNGASAGGVWLRNLAGNSTNYMWEANGSGVIQAATVTTLNITSSWQRFTWTNQSGSTGATHFMCVGAKSTTGETPNIAAQTVSMWQGQIENSSREASSDIYTTSATVTRTVETVSTANPLVLGNPETWCMSATGTHRDGLWSASAANKTLLQLGTTDAANSAKLYFATAAPTFGVYDSAAAVKAKNGGAATAAAHRLVASAANGTLTLTSDTVDQSTATGAGTGKITQPATLYLGSSSTSTLHVNGWLSNILVGSSTSGCN